MRIFSTARELARAMASLSVSGTRAEDFVLCINNNEVNIHVSGWCVHVESQLKIYNLKLWWQLGRNPPSARITIGQIS